MGHRVSKSRVRQGTPTVDGGMTGRASRRQSGERVPVEGDYLRLHQGSRQGYVLVGEPGARRRQYVGPFWTDGSERAVSPATLEAARLAILERALGAAAAPEALTVAELARRYMAHVRTKYAARASRIPHHGSSMRLLEEFAGSLPAEGFGPLRLRAFRESLVRLRRKDSEESRYTRKSVNEHVQRVAVAFRWGVSMELVPESVHAALRTVLALEAGEVATLREGKKVEDAPVDDVLRVLPFLSAELAAVVRVMLLTAARPSEILELRGADLTEGSDGWFVVPVQHKNKHRGHTRKIPLTAAAMEVLEPFIEGRLPTAFLFSPAEAERRRHRRRTDARTTPEGLGHSPGDSQRTRTGREALVAPGDVYTAASFRRAVQRACERAGVPVFTPYMLRHSSATLVEAEMDELHAGAVLGDRDARAAETYHKSKQRDIRARKAADVLAAKLEDALGEVG